MHAAWASFPFAFAASVTAVAAAAFFAFAVSARSPEAACTVPRRQPASRQLPTAIAHDTTKNEACHVA